VDQELVTEMFSIDHESTRTIRSQPDDFANDAIAGNVDGREMSWRVEGASKPRAHQQRTRGRGAAQKVTSIEPCTHPAKISVIWWRMSRFPEWLVPMAATLTQERFTGPEWLFERKFDGIRLLAFKRGHEVQLFSRNHLPQNVPVVSQAIERLRHDELIC